MEIYQIQLVEPNSGQLRTICVFPGLEAQEFHEILMSSFSLQLDNGPVGLCDRDGVNYPLSAVVRSPEIFGGGQFTILLAHAQGHTDHVSSMAVSDSEDMIYTEERAKRAFQLLDKNSDNYVHKEEFIEMLTAAMTSLFASNPRYSFAYACISPKDMAVVTAIQCYKMMEGGVESYLMDFDDFCSWYLSSGGDQYRELLIRAVDCHSGLLTSSSNFSVSSGKQKPMKRTKSQTNLNLSGRYVDGDIMKFISLCRQALLLDDGGTMIFYICTMINEFADGRSNIDKASYLKGLMAFLDFRRDVDQVTTDTDGASAALDLLFDILNPSKSPFVHILHFASMLAVIADGSVTESLNTVFKLYPGAGTGFITDDIVYNHVLQIARIVFYFGSDVPRITGCTAEDLAHACTAKMLSAAELNRTAKFAITFSELLELVAGALQLVLQRLEISAGFFNDMLEEVEIGIVESGGNGDGNDNEDDPVVDVEDSDSVQGLETIRRVDTAELEESQVASFLINYSGNAISTSEASDILGLTEYSPNFVIEYLSSFADKSGQISQTSFQRGISRLIGRQYISLSVLERSKADFIIDRLFQVFDSFNTGTCNLKELGCGLMLFCGQDYRVRAQTAYKLQHTFGPTSPRKSSLNFHLVKNSLASLFEGKACLDPSVTDFSRVQYVAEKEAMDYISKVNEVRQLKKTEDNNKLVKRDYVDFFASIMKKITEYEEYYTELFADTSVSQVENIKQKNGAKFPLRDASARQHAIAEYNQFLYDNKDGSSGVGAFSEDSGDDDDNLYLDDKLFPPSAVVLELRAASSILGLESYTADSMMETLAKRSHAGSIDISGWFDWLNYVTNLSGISDQDVPIASNLGEAFFLIFDTEDAGMVEFTELGCGLSFLCGSPLEEKIMVAFTLMDDNCDGYITAAQFEQLIHSVLRAIVVCSKFAADRIMSLGTDLAELSHAAAKEGLVALDVGIDEELTLEMVTEVCDDFLKLAATH